MGASSEKITRRASTLTRLRRERLQKARDAMVAHDLGAVVTIRGGKTAAI